MPDFQILERVRNFLALIPKHERGKIYSHLNLLIAGETEGLAIKTLSSNIKELIVNKYRLLFFNNKEGKVYIVDIFRKQSRKTPLHILARAEKIHQVIQNTNP